MVFGRIFRGIKNVVSKIARGAGKIINNPIVRGVLNPVKTIVEKGDELLRKATRPIGRLIERVPVVGKILEKGAAFIANKKLNPFAAAKEALDLTNVVSGAAKDKIGSGVKNKIIGRFKL